MILCHEAIELCAASVFLISEVAPSVVALFTIASKASRHKVLGLL